MLSLASNIGLVVLMKNIKDVDLMWSLFFTGTPYLRHIYANS
jgi:hypothetical protein